MPRKQNMLILASSSPRRVDLLREAGIAFKIKVPRVEEVKAENWTMSPRRLALYNALLKANDISKSVPGKLVIGADTIVVLGKQVYGKPKDFKDAIRMLQELCGRTHEVLTGVCLSRKGKKLRSFIVSTKVSFKKLTKPKIIQYLKLIHPLDKAGAYAAQEHCDFIIRKVTGSFSNVVGLPMEKLKKVLQSLELKSS